jgi:hypothetical protein
MRHVVLLEDAECVGAIRRSVIWRCCSGWQDLQPPNDGLEEEDCGKETPSVFATIYLG